MLSLFKLLRMPFLLPLILLQYVTTTLIDVLLTDEEQEAMEQQ